MKCPTCKSEFSERIEGAWPFCSKRCKMIDFGRWTEEDYRIPGGFVDPESIPRSALPLDEDDSDSSSEE